jgi:hypothetical protein
MHNILHYDGIVDPNDGWDHRCHQENAEYHRSAGYYALSMRLVVVSQQVCGRHGSNFILGFVLSHTGYIAGDLLERSAIIRFD